MKNEDIVKITRIPKHGYIWVILAAVMWGLSGSAAKFLFNSGVTSFQLVQLRLTVSVVILFVWFQAGNRGIFRIERKDLGYFVILGAGVMAAVQFTYLLAISRIQVAAAILLQYMAPGMIALYGVIFAREKLNRVTITAVIVATAGCYLVVGAYHMDMASMNRTGIISGLLSAVCFAWYSLLGEYGMRKYSSWTVLFYAFLFASLSWNIFYPPFEAFRRSYSLQEWGWILYIGIFGTALPFGFYLRGVSLIRSTRASITAMLEPITAGVVAWFFLNEFMDLSQIIGGVLVLFSVVLLQLRSGYDDRTPDLIRSQQHKEMV